MRTQLMAGGGQPFMHDNDGNPLQHYWERGVMKVTSLGMNLRGS